MSGMKADPIHAEAAFDDPPAPRGALARLKHFGRMLVAARARRA